MKLFKIQFIIKHPSQNLDKTSTKHTYGPNRRNRSLTHKLRCKGDINLTAWTFTVNITANI